VKTSKKILFGVLTGVIIFGFTQYIFATQIDVIIMENELVEQNEEGSTYNLQMEFDNPSLLILNAGKTEFEVLVDDKKIGSGILEPFVLNAMSKSVVEGTFLTTVGEQKYEYEQTPEIQISGVTRYNVLFTSIDIPFIYFPPEEQAREFIQQN